MQSNPFQKFIDRYIGIPIVIFLVFINFILLFFNKVFKSSHQNETTSPKKILFIQLSALGDTILAIPTIRAIRDHFPQAELSFLATQINLSYLEQCPYIDRRIQFSYPIHKLVKELRRENFDCVIDLEHWPRLSVLLTYATGAPRRVGFSAAYQYRHYLFTDILHHVPGKHEVLNFLSIAYKLGCAVNSTDLEVWISETETEWCQTLFIQEGIDTSASVVVLHPEAGRRGEPRRRWHQDRYVALADMLVSRYGVHVVLTGAPNEVAVSQHIADRTEANVICVAGKTQVNQLTALFSNANLVVCGNCGPMHLASAAGTPVIALHGPTNSKQWGPWGKEAICLEAAIPCSPCLNLGFEYGCQALPDGTSPCMWTIEVSDVLQACEKYLNR